MISTMPQKKRSSKKAAKKSVNKASKKKIVKTQAKKLVKKSVKKPAKKIAKKSVKKPVKKADKKIVKKSKSSKKITKKKILKKSVKRRNKFLSTSISKEEENLIVDELIMQDSPEDIHFQRLDREAKELFHVQKKRTFYNWVKKYSPVLIPLMVGLMSYVYLTFFVFYPGIITNGHFVKFLFLVMFAFLLAGVFIHLGIKHELIFIRILSFLFVFVILSFMVLFVLIAHVISSGVL